MFFDMSFFFYISEPTPSIPSEPQLPRMKKKDLTLKELAKYDGTGEDGRVLVGVLGKIYDVTKGKRFYGPGTILHNCGFYDTEI